MRCVKKAVGIVLLSVIGWASPGVYASESGHGAASQHGKSMMDASKTAPGVRAMHTQPPLSMFEPASTATPPRISVLFPAIAASLAVLLAVINAGRRPQC